MSFKVAYVPIGVGTFHLESAQQEFEKSIALLKSITPDVVVPEKMLLSLDLLDAYLDSLTPDLIILQNITFANAAYASEVLRRFDTPILLWTLREPVIDGGRLRLNSLTGAFSAANSIRYFRKGKKFEYIFGAPEEKEVEDKIRATVDAARVKYELKQLKIVSIGHTPQGFGFGRALDQDMMSVFGASLDSIESRELINKAKGFTDAECESYLTDAEQQLVGLDKMPEKNIKDFARLYKAYKDYVTENHIGAISSRCWPDFFTEFGTPVCTVLSLLNALGVNASCESDTYGALSMYIGSKLTGKSCFFGDPVSLDEKENSITFWHCGMAACNLARQDTGAVVGVHPNRKIGPTMEFGCEKADHATIFRVGRDEYGKFRFFIARGSVMDKPRQFLGTSIVVKTENPSRRIIEQAVEDGWEPHYVVAYGDCAKQLEILGHMLNIDVYLF
ncbi:fucose isomerase [Oribacterium sp. HCP28S3_H8]|jgi:L-fucose isomerase-like protein|uniref:fucose isomerase n=1 Tax=Oribacterium sp. HCP28S3_H8 TaxID=3438945 RepID=UPI003F888AB8